MQINIKTVTPIHIGSGVELQGNAEFLYFEKEKVAAVLDQEKVLKLIGEQNIDKWVSFIEQREQGSFLQYLLQRKPDLQPNDVASRVVQFRGTRFPRPENPMREQIRSGMGRPYIPGSSLKGAIRTAILAAHLHKVYGTSGIEERMLGRFNQRANRFVFDSKVLESQTFGKDPNSDWMRLLSLGDCHFDTQTIMAWAEVLNQRGDRYEMKNQVAQLAEFIPAKASGTSHLRIADEQRKLVERRDPGLFNGNQRQLELSWLLSLLNKHTVGLLESELGFFESAELPAEADALMEHLNELLDAAKALPPTSCMLRLGYGTGYRTMTGNWVKDLIKDDSLYFDIGNAMRRNTKYDGMDVPKSRKTMLGGRLMGFVTIST
jgi:CRISPR-associated protein Csm5